MVSPDAIWLTMGSGVKSVVGRTSVCGVGEGGRIGGEAGITLLGSFHN